MAGRFLVNHLSAQAQAVNILLDLMARELGRSTQMGLDSGLGDGLVFSLAMCHELS